MRPSPALYTDPSRDEKSWLPSLVNAVFVFCKLPVGHLMSVGLDAYRSQDLGLFNISYGTSTRTVTLTHPLSHSLTQSIILSLSHSHTRAHVNMFFVSSVICH